MTPPLSAFPRNRRPVRDTRPRRIVLGVLAVVFLVVVVFPWLTSFATDWLWYNEIHFESVFLESLFVRGLLFVVTGLFAFAFVYGNVRWVRRGAAAFPTLFLDRGSGVRVDVSHLIPRLILVAAVFVASVAALIVSTQWLPVLMALHGVPVGEADPLFGRDIGFYLFRLP